MKARDSGSAVGYATAKPGTIARIAEWIKKAESKGHYLGADHDGGDQGQVIVTLFCRCRIART